jgi:tellurite resistance protein TehA-like permease
MSVENEKPSRFKEAMYDFGSMLLIAFSVAGSLLLIMDPPNIAATVLASINLAFITVFLFLATTKIISEELIKRKGRLF